VCSGPAIHKHTTAGQSASQRDPDQAHGSPLHS
jgi:hypothetical protein